MNAGLGDPIVNRALKRVGTHLCGRYRLVRLIGVGGMAAVYAGVHRNGHGVAIKILHERLATDPEIERLFRREAQLANQVGHPGVVSVIDDDVTEDGCVFLVMPLLQGETLRARAERLGGKLPVEEVMVVAHAVLEVLGAAHAKKIVHRDIKPENIFVTCDGDIRVLDFGIGRFFESSEASATKSGRALGTPAFMAPEQALGRTREVDGRTDIWALGATMFSLLTGRFVHEAESPTEIAVLAATRPARSLGATAPEVAEPIRVVVDRALAFTKGDRWTDAGSMDRKLLGACRDGLGRELDTIVVAPPPRHESADGQGAATITPKRSPDARDDVEERGESTERLRAATTRTSTGYPLRGAPAAVPPTRTNLLLGVLAVAVIGAAAVTIAGLKQSGTKQGTAPTAMESSAFDLAELTSSPPSAAVADFQGGVQLWREASSSLSVRRFLSAAEAAPTFAAAHLWLVLAADYVSPRVREHYASAALHRASLTAAQLDLLDALGPSMGDPSNLAETVSRLERLERAHPENADLPAIVALACIRLGDNARGLGALPPEAAPSDVAVSSYARARLLASEGDPVAATSALSTCLDQSDFAADCLDEQWDLATNEGECATLEPLCRRLLAASPSSVEVFECLANALSSSGASLDDLRANFEEQEKRIPADTIARQRAQNAVSLAIFDGRFDDAESLAGQWQRAADNYENPAILRGAPISTRFELALELGAGERASRLAREYAAKSKSWPRSDFTDTEAASIYMLSAAGLLTTKERGVMRQRLLVRAGAPSYGPPWRRWYNAYVITSWTNTEAKDAVAHVPLELHGPDHRSAEEDFFIGRAFLLAGDPARALPFFRRGAHSCSFADDIYRTRSMLQLGLLSEEQPLEACAIYNKIERHWRHTPKGVTARQAATRSNALHCHGN